MMSIWNLALWAALAATIGSGISYTMAVRAAGTRGSSSLSRSRQRELSGSTRAGRSLMAASFALLLVASAGLLSRFLAHDFSFEYVAHNSSRGLESLYMVSAFWAGQEGSLLLWALFSSAFGCLLMVTAGEHERTSMPWYALSQAMLLVVALRMTPFATLAEPPADGLGLNPLLMNPWMAIHPPIVFAGYAAIAAPYALAMSALTRGEYQSWAPAATWWNLLAWLLLGSGIMIGARWAYSVLGWGGYWGWDPVENASLVPWLFGGALLHTFLSQKARGKMVRTNIALAILTYLLIGYGAFLTRSGVLSDFSVHSFADLGISSYLILFILAIGFPAAAFFIARFKGMSASRKYQEVYEGLASRDFGIFAGGAVILASAVITLLGTSAPILTRITGDPQAVDTSFYNITNYPLGVLMAVLMGLFPLFRWGSDELKSAKGAIIGSALLALAGALAAAAAGARGAYYLVFLFASFFGLFANLYMFIKTIRHGARFIGSYLTHLGVALAFAGIIATGGWALTERALVPIGGSVEAVGYRIEAVSADESEDGTTMTVPLRLYRADKLVAEGAPYMQVTGMGSTMRHPMIFSTLVQDVYISPLTLEGASSTGMAAGGKQIQVKKGGSASAEGLEVAFSAFDLSEMNSGKVGAALKVSSEGAVLFDGTLYYSVSGAAGDDSSVSLDAAGVGYELTIEGIDASSGLVYLGLAEAGAVKPVGAEGLLLEVSRKPFVWLLWIGASMIVLGTAVAVVRRKMEAK